LVKYEGWSLKVTNKMDPRWWEGHFLQTTDLLGQSATLDVQLRLTNSPDLRAALNSLTRAAVSLKLDPGGTGTHWVKIDFGAKAYVSKLPQDLPLGKEFIHNVTFTMTRDPATGLAVILTSGTN
jgi:hypothetical protein